MVPPPTLQDVHERALAALEERLRALAGREDRARRALQLVETERHQLEAERAALEVAERVYQRTTGVEIAEPHARRLEDESTTETGKLKARVGEQRYLILSSLRGSQNGLEIASVAAETGLGFKRVKDQLVSDELINVVRSVWGRYQLTEIGLDLLSRFEDYKRRRGEELPTLSTMSEEEGEDS